MEQCTNEIFVNEFMVKLEQKLPNDILNLISKELSIYCGDFNITRMSTELVPIQVLPRAYHAFVVTKKIEGRSMETLKLYRLRLEPFFNTVQKDLCNITTNDIRRYLYLFQDQRKVSNRTLDGVRLVLNSFFGWCAKEGYCDKNVCAAIAPIKYVPAPRGFLTDIQMEKLRSGCKTAREHAIVETLYATGCRVSELCRLNRDQDIDFSDRNVELLGKGAKIHFTGINARAMVALQEYLSQRKDDCEALFISVRKKNGKYHRLTRAGIRIILKKIASRVEVDNVYPHKIRHTFATDAIEHGMPLPHLQKLLGHSKMETTMIYVDIGQSQVKNSYSKYVV